MTSSEEEEGKLYEGLKLDLRSTKADQSSEDARCLVKFHNCTNDNVSLYWLDFEGTPIKYATLGSKQTISMDTFRSHLWFFESVKVNNRDGSLLFKRVIAITEEVLDSSCFASRYNFEQVTDEQELANLFRSIICPMCRYILKKYSRKPTKSPCPHYSGEAKLSSSDLGVRSHSDFNSTGDFIYSCSEDTHKKCHSQSRRNIYLVQSFYNLRERCFIQMNKQRLERLKVANLNLPTSVLRDYIQFAAALDKLKK